MENVRGRDWSVNPTNIGLDDNVYAREMESVQKVKVDGVVEWDNYGSPTKSRAILFRGAWLLMPPLPKPLVRAEKPELSYNPNIKVT